MGDRFSVKGLQTTVAGPPADYTLELDGVVTTRGKIYDIVVGMEAAPADVTFIHTVQRLNALGTGTATTPGKLDNDSPAALLQVQVNNTVEPTYVATAKLLEVAVNQRATFRWVAAPGGELLVAAIATAGIGIFALDVVGAATIDTFAQIHWEE